MCAKPVEVSYTPNELEWMKQLLDEVTRNEDEHEIDRAMARVWKRKLEIQERVNGDGQ